MKITTVTAAFACAVLLVGCGSTTTSRVATGTGMGAATGAAIGSFSGNAGRGALIGAGVGALGGVLVDEHQRGSFSNN
ncbi:glycine zipper family protein [Thiocapsa bogorovii]|uniref:glycine zipper family protein n=1 Tax=Thiocapsa bogorovii TaxID=521689 RepID=UPI001E377409|nr:glycine zipper family protein [Thiocapsa bogorovii]UHD15386.1 glycine zipper domain-containing protein [Thiocapsa bogorovii]